VQLHNETLKAQVSSLHAEVTECRQQLAERETDIEARTTEVDAYAADVDNLEQRARDAEHALQKVYWTQCVVVAFQSECYLSVKLKNLYLS